MANAQEYQSWLAGGNTDAALIETIQIEHVNWGSIWLANWGEDITCTLEDGTTQQLFTKANFEISGESVSDTTEQTLQLRISSLGGLLYQALVDMDYVARADPIKITHRMYLSTNLGQVVTTPVPKWYLSSVTATFTELNGELTATPMRLVRIGRYYTSREFASLAYL
jgi:hypothetical protein